MVPAVTNASIRVAPQSSSATCPLSSEIDPALLQIIQRIEDLYRAGKREFAILTHQEPDPDAAAAARGMRYLLALLLPSDVSVRTFVAGNIPEELSRNGRFLPEPLNDLRQLFATTESARRTAIVLVDQPTLSCERVLPCGFRNVGDLPIPREADVVVDHHASLERSAPGFLRYGGAGSTSALMLRALQIATELRTSRCEECSWYHDRDLALLMNVGAWTDAGVPLSRWDQIQALPPSVQWVHEETKGRFDSVQIKDFDLSECFGSLRTSVNQTKTVCESVLLDGKTCTVIVGFAGIVRDSNRLGAFTSQYLTELKDEGVPTTSLGLAIFAVLRDPSFCGDNSEQVLATERVKLCVRTTGGVCADRLAKIISEDSGGRETGAAAILSIPIGLHAQHKDTFAGCCLRYLQAKLEGKPAQGWD